MRRNMSWSCALAVALFLTGCSPPPEGVFSDIQAPPALPAGSVPHAKTHISMLGVQQITTGAADAASLKSLLARSGYLVGRERTFVSRRSPLDRADTRVLEFRSSDGAAQYLHWVASHPGDLIGDARAGAPLGLAGAPQVYVHTPNGCCPKDVPKSLAVWQRDRYVLEVIANGGLAKQKALLGLATQLDGII